MSFVGFSAFEADAPKEATTRRAYGGRDAALALACKQCGKKDGTTRLKGLQGLRERVACEDVGGEELALVAAWWSEAAAIRLVFFDDDARVRDRAGKG